MHENFQRTKETLRGQSYINDLAEFCANGSKICAAIAPDQTYPDARQRVIDLENGRICELTQFDRDIDRFFGVVKVITPSREFVPEAVVMGSAIVVIDLMNKSLARVKPECGFQNHEGFAHEKPKPLPYGAFRVSALGWIHGLKS